MHYLQLRFQVCEVFPGTLDSGFKFISTDDAVRTGIDQPIHRALRRRHLPFEQHLTLRTFWRGQASLIFLTKNQGMSQRFASILPDSLIKLVSVDLLVLAGTLPPSPDSFHLIAPKTLPQNLSQATGPGEQGRLHRAIFCL